MFRRIYDRVISFFAAIGNAILATPKAILSGIVSASRAIGGAVLAAPGVVGSAVARVFGGIVSAVTTVGSWLAAPFVAVANLFRGKSDASATVNTEKKEEDTVDAAVNPEQPVSATDPAFGTVTTPVKEVQVKKPAAEAGSIELASESEESSPVVRQLFPSKNSADSSLVAAGKQAFFSNTDRSDKEEKKMEPIPFLSPEK